MAYRHPCERVAWEPVGVQYRCAYNRGVRTTTQLIGSIPLNRDETDQRTPTTIDLDAQNGLMRIVWADGHESLYELPALRRSCPCAGCSGELAGRGTATRGPGLRRARPPRPDGRRP